MHRQIVFMAPSGRNQDGSDPPYSPHAVAWAAIRVLQTQELDKAQQIAQELIYLVATPWQRGITQQMRVIYQDESNARTLEIKGIEDVDLRQIELRLRCSEIENLELENFTAPLSISQGGIFINPASPSVAGAALTRHYPTQAPDGSRVTFTFNGQAASDVAFQLFLGVLLNEGDENDYTIEIGGGVTVVTLADPPLATQELIAFF
jgi:SPP1 family predicted phage head-tail adaptor